MQQASSPRSWILSALILGTLLLTVRLAYADELPVLPEPWLRLAPTAVPELVPDAPADAIGLPYAVSLPLTFGAPPSERYAAISRAYELELLRLIADERAKHSLPVTTEAAALTQAARRHAADMAAHDMRGHIGTDGTDPGQRMVQEGYGGVAWGEASGLGGSTPQAIFDAWMQSPPHQGILLDPLAHDIGVGYADNPTGVYHHAWVVDTGH